MSYKDHPYKRYPAQRSIRKILIVCEGGKTEPYYFKAFQLNGDLITVKIDGAGRIKDSLVEYAIVLKQTAELKKDPYNIVWCVFDRDISPENPHDKQQFNRAIYLARNKVRVAYSNDAFEIWYILHFNYLQSPLHRAHYERKLTELLGSKYSKTRTDMYEKLKDRQQFAIANAEKLLGNYCPHNPESDNPCTTVHKLVQYLNKYLDGE